MHITNEAFLRAIFGEAWPDAHVCGFPEDPSTPGDPGRWLGRRYRDLTQEARDALRTMNAYFTISLFRDVPDTGQARRRKSLLRATHCIVIDDVGTKVDPKHPSLLTPTWILETSPGNHQWGYRLEPPETDWYRVEAFQRGLIKAGLCEDGTDPGMFGVTRYARLPEGVNTKRKWVESGGGSAFRCKLVAGP